MESCFHSQVHPLKDVEKGLGTVIRLWNIKESRTRGREQLGGAQGQAPGWIEGKLLRVLNTLGRFSYLRRNGSKEKKWLRWSGVVKGSEKPPPPTPPHISLHICYASGKTARVLLKRGDRGLKTTTLKLPGIEEPFEILSRNILCLYFRKTADSSC